MDSSHHSQVWSLATMRGADGVDDSLVPNITVEDYDILSSAAGQKSFPAIFIPDGPGIFDHDWSYSPNSFRGSEEMNSASSSSSSPISNLSSTDGSYFPDLQPFDPAMGRTSRSCPPSLLTSPAFSPPPQNWNFSPMAFDNVRYQPPPTSSGPSTELLDNCDPIRQNIPAGIPSSFLPPTSSRMNEHVQYSDSGNLDYFTNPKEPRPPDYDLCFDFSALFSQKTFDLAFQAGDAEESLAGSSSLTTYAGGRGDSDPPIERPLRGRRSRSESELRHKANGVSTKAARNAPYPSRSPSRTLPEPQGYFRPRVSTEASKKVSDARRIAPAPHQCHLCPDTFTRADGLQNHIDRHNGQGKKTKCDFCMEEKTTISRHMRSCTKNPDREPSKRPRRNTGGLPC